MSGAPGRNVLERDFAKVLDEEIAWINEGRKDGEKLKPPCPSGPSPVQGAGLALSGGGIRSAAFCLGAMQALDVHLKGGSAGPGGIRFFDYMSLPRNSRGGSSARPSRRS